MPECKMFRHGMTIGPTGSVRPCCAIETPTEPAKITDPHIWRPRHEDQHQRSLTTWLPECEECRQGEELYGHSLRTRANQQLTNNPGIQYWDLKINNTCNLACRMCSSWSSSIWEQLGKQYPELDEPQMPRRWHREVEDLLPALVDAKVLKFTGGEPLMIPQVKRVMEYLIENDIASVVDLEITTNGTQDFGKWIPLFNKFKSVVIVVSIDAVGERFEYIRAGAKWEQVSNNVIHLNRNKSNGTCIAVIALPQALNANHMHEVKDWCAINNIAYSASPPLLDPEYMKISALTDPNLNAILIKRMELLDKIHATDYRKFI